MPYHTPLPNVPCHWARIDFVVIRPPPGVGKQWHGQNALMSNLPKQIRQCTLKLDSDVLDAVRSIP